MTIFSVENTEFGWNEIVLAAQIWGEWQPFLETTRQSLACLRAAVKTGRMPDAAEAREAATAFRYAHNLISSEEARSWLARWGMTVDDWMNYLRGLLLRELWAGRLGEIVETNPVTDDEVAQVIRIHAVCADKLN